LQDIAAQRRSLPRVAVKNPSQYQFDDPATGKTRSLADLFDGRKQLILYHFMLGPNDKEGCNGCSLVMDHTPPHLEHLWSRDTTFAAVATAPPDKVNQFKERMGWTFPFYSATTLHDTWKEAEAAGETITWKPGNGYFGHCVFIKEGEDIYHTYSLTDRGCEIFLGTYHLLDLTPLGRQEEGNEMDRFVLHDKYPKDI
jgi:predicted dithiol-disulfide oxidoreductase (DUF899 family)